MEGEIEMKILNLLIESLNQVIISFALMYVGFLFNTNFVSVLFMASEFWLISVCTDKYREMTDNKTVSYIIVIVNIFISIGTFYLFYIK